jgi:hypothetical protein
MNTFCRAITMLYKDSKYLVFGVCCISLHLTLSFQSSFNSWCSLIGHCYWRVFQ